DGARGPRGLIDLLDLPAERAAGARRPHPRLAPLEPLDDARVHRARPRARLLGAHRRRARSVAARAVDHRREAELGELRAPPRIDRRRVLAAARDVLRRAVEAD